MAQTLWIARHGNRADFVDDEWRENAERPHDPPLSQDGIQQARELGQRLAGEGLSHIFASPFLRTVQTASYVADAVGLPVCIERGLCEWLKEDWFPDGMPHFLSSVTLAQRFPRVNPAHKSVAQPAYPEVWEEASARAMLTATLLAARFQGDILVVGHGATVLGICYGLLSERPEKISAPCCGLTKLVRQGDGWVLEFQGDRSHLREPRGDDRFV